jgi:hypothetical protein
MRTARLAGPAVVLLLAFAPAAPAQFTGTKVVETGGTYPGIGTISTSGFGGPPSLTGGTVAFTATTTTASQGVYTAAGGVYATVANTATAVPGGAGNFNSFNALSVGQSASGVAFLAGAASPTLGVYTTVNGPLAPVAALGGAYVGGTGTFTGLSVPSVSGTTVVFGGTNGAGGTSLGIFSSAGGGPVTVVANTSTPVPGGTGNFTSFTDPVNGPSVPSVSGSNVVFGAQGGGRFGVYVSLAGTITPVATNLTTAPGGTGAFTSFGITPAVSGSAVGIYGVSPGRAGIYEWTQAGGLTRVADTTTAVPGGTGTFAGFTPGPGSFPVSLDGGHVAFVGTNSGGQAGVYTDLTGSLAKVVGVGDAVGAKTVSALTMSDYALSGSAVAVTLRFTDGSQAVYTFAPTPVPEPAGVLAVAAAAGLVGARVRRLRRGRAAG